MHRHKRARIKMYQRIRYARAHLSRKEYTDILSRPAWRTNPKANINIVKDPYAISRAALKCRPTRRIKILSRPIMVRQKYDPEKASDGYPEIRLETLTATPSRRILDLALPNKRLLMETRKFAVNNKIMFELVNEMLSMGKRKKWRPVNQKNIDALAQPVFKDLPEMPDPFKVQPSALAYKISARMNEIAVRKNPPEILPPRVPGAVSPGAMKAVATPRTIILAKPMVRPPGVETDLNENAFTVSPAALKAKCPKRIQELAQPKTYGKS